MTKAAHPEPLSSFLVGGWRLIRRIRDLRAGDSGRLRGSAQFVTVPDGLDFVEHGGLRLPHGEVEARQSYRFRIEGPCSFGVFFQDGRPFHRAAFSGGIARVAHDCAPDTYRGRYRILGPDRWSLGWRVTGPRKNLVIVSIFSRAGVR